MAMGITPPPGSRIKNIVPIRQPNITEQSVMRAFVLDHEDTLRFDHTRGKWFVWDRHYWREDDRKRAFYWALEHCHSLGVKKAERIGFSNAVETAARAMPPLAIAASDWNPVPTLIACPSGVIDLETGAIRDGKPEDMIDRCLAVVPDASCPGDVWFAFLAQVFPQGGVIDFLHRWGGYSLSGLTSEQKFIFLHGTGANGKGTFMSLLQQIWGDYCCTAPVETFLEARHERHPTEIARLAGRHMVQINESREGRRWDESKIKNLTGGDKIPARFMQKDFFEFQPLFKPMFAGNHKPHLRTVDEAMRRRILMVPCTVTIPVQDRDPKLGEKLLAEAPRVLAYFIDGFQSWRRLGLMPPKCVTEATEDYLANQDDVQQWLDEATEANLNGDTAAQHLFGNWMNWKALRGEDHGSQRSFTEKLIDKGFRKKTFNYGVGILNIRLKLAPVSATAQYNIP